MTPNPHMYVGRPRPGLRLQCVDDDGNAVDLSAYSFEVVLEQDGVESTLTCSVTAPATPANGTPSAIVSFAAGALDNISVGPGVVKLIATLSGLPREFQAPVLVGT